MKGLLTSNFNKYYLTSQGNELSKGYRFNKGGEFGDLDLLNAQWNRIKIINNFASPLKNVYTNRPTIKISMDKVVINVFYYSRKKKMNFNVNTINNLGELLSNVFNRPVELKFIKLKYPYLDRTIFAKYLVRNTPNHGSKRLLKFGMKITPVFKNGQELTQHKLFKQYKLPSYVLGIKVIISGRLRTQRVKARETVRSRQIGSFKHQANTLMDFGQSSTWNEVGSLGVKVWIYQKKLIENN